MGHLKLVISMWSPNVLWNNNFIFSTGDLMKLWTYVNLKILSSESLNLNLNTGIMIISCSHHFVSGTDSLYLWNWMIKMWGLLFFSFTYTCWCHWVKFMKMAKKHKKNLFYPGTHRCGLWTFVLITCIYQWLIHF